LLTFTHPTQEFKAVGKGFGGEKMKVSELRALLNSPDYHGRPNGRWSNLPVEYDFVDVFGDGDVTWDWVDRNAKGIEGCYKPGCDDRTGERSLPGKLCIRILMKDGKPLVSRIARNITHEWVHHWLHVNEGELTSLAFDNVARKARL